MRNLKKIITGILSTLVISSCLSLVSISVSADVSLDNLETISSATYGVHQYYLPEDFDIQDVLNDENLSMVLNGNTFALKSIKISPKANWQSGDKTYDVVNGVLPIIQEEYDNISYIFEQKDIDSSLLNEWYYTETNNTLDKVIPNIGTSSGDSNIITEFTVGESTYPRGDINLDGNVNTVDLLMLKKYLLGLMEW